MENYFLLFIDSLTSSSILPIRQGFVFKVMLHFKQHYSILLILLVGTFGSSLGGIINWCAGRAVLSLRRLYHKLYYNIQNEYITRKVIKNLLICAVTLFSWAPVLGSVVQLLSGCFKLSPYLFIPLVILSNFCYLLYLAIFV